MTNNRMNASSLIFDELDQAAEKLKFPGENRKERLLEFCRNSNDERIKKIGYDDYLLLQETLDNLSDSVRSVPHYDFVLDKVQARLALIKWNDSMPEEHKSNAFAYVVNWLNHFVQREKSRYDLLFSRLLSNDDNTCPAIEKEARSVFFEDDGKGGLRSFFITHAELAEFGIEWFLKRYDFVSARRIYRSLSFKRKMLNYWNFLMPRMMAATSIGLFALMGVAEGWLMVSALPLFWGILFPLVCIIFFVFLRVGKKTYKYPKLLFQRGSVVVTLFILQGILLSEVFYLLVGHEVMRYVLNQAPWLEIASNVSLLIQFPLFGSALGILLQILWQEQDLTEKL